MQKDDLYNLMRSLTQTEKRYFKLNAVKQVKGEKNDYQELFDLVDKKITAGKSNAEIDELLSEKYSSPKSRTQLSQTKHYLFESVLEILQGYHKKESLTIRIMQMIQQAEVLLKKAQYKIALQRLAQAKELAIETERFAELLCVIAVEKTVLSRQGDLRKNGAQLTEANLLEKNIISGLALYSEINSMYSGVFLRSLEGNHVAFDEILPEAHSWWEKHKDEEISFQTRVTGLALLMGIYKSRGESEKSVSYARQIIDLFEKVSPKLAKVNENRYQATLYNYFIELGRIVSEEELEREMNLRLRNENMSDTVRENLEINNLVILSTNWIQHGSFESVKKFKAEYDRVFSSFEKIDRYREKYYHGMLNSAICFFATGDYAEARKKINALLGVERAVLPAHLASSLHVMLLFICIAQGDGDLFDYQFAAWQRFRKNNPETDTDVLRFLAEHFPELMRAVEDQQNEVIQNIRNRYDSLTTKSRITQGLDAGIWLQSLLNKTSYPETYRRVNQLSGSKASAVKQK